MVAAAVTNVKLHFAAESNIWPTIDPWPGSLRMCWLAYVCLILYSVGYQNQNHIYPQGQTTTKFWSKEENSAKNRADTKWVLF